MQYYAHQGLTVMSNDTSVPLSDKFKFLHNFYNYNKIFM